MSNKHKPLLEIYILLKYTHCIVQMNTTVVNECAYGWNKTALSIILTLRCIFYKCKY